MKMSSIIIFLVIACGLFLLGVLFFLAYLNWSYKIQASLISIVLVGTGTIIVTIFSGLKDQVISDKFVCPVFVQDKSPRFAVYPVEKHRFHGTSAMLSQYADHSGAGVINDSFVFEKYPKPVKDAEWFEFDRETFTYCLLRMMSSISLRGGSFDLSKGTEAISILKADLPPDNIAVKYKDIDAKFSRSNALEYEGGLSSTADLYTINLPKGTHVSIHSIHESNQRPATLIEFKKEWYFNIAIKVTQITEPSFDLPENLRNSQVDLSHIRSFSYLIESSATFNKYASSGDKTASYIIWHNSLFAALKQSFSNGY